MAPCKTPTEMKTAMENFKITDFLFQEFPGAEGKPSNHHLSYKFQHHADEKHVISFEAG